jgi:glyoxylase-like metal-dependent hydrolase (beta-lactamase superfamily II)
LFVHRNKHRAHFDRNRHRRKWPPKLADIYGIKRERSLLDSLRAITGVGAEDISIVVNTHLHFDHAGGNSRLDDAGNAVPTFPNARYLVSRHEYEHAEAPLERDRASYMPENWRPLKETGQLELKESDYEIAPGVNMETVTGHNHSMQCLRLTRDGRTLYSFADLVPMRAHVPFAWIMGYDLYPVETLEGKSAFCRRRRAKIGSAISITTRTCRSAALSKKTETARRRLRGNAERIHSRRMNDESALL